MQEKFVLKAKKAVKKVAAISTGVAMLGATLTGAMALDLGDFPEPFVVNGKYDPSNVFVVGATAAADDSLGVLDIGAKLQFESKTCVAAGTGGSGLIVGGDAEVEDIPLGKNLNDTSDGFGATIDDDDVEGFQDTVIRIDINDVDDDYDVRDEIRFAPQDSNVSSPSVETGTSFSSNRDEDWKDRIFIPVPRSSVGYFYVFENNLKAGNYINDSSATDEIEIEFLGQHLEIEAATSTTITVNVGERFDLTAGDSIVVNGKTITFQSASSGNKVRVNVDGISEVVTEDDEEIINGIEIRVEDVADEQGIEFDAATLFIGEDARETYENGEEYIGEDEDDPIWVWKLYDLNTDAPALGILWDLDLDDEDENENPAYEHPLYEGESLCLPSDYACITFDSVTINDYQDYELDTSTVQLFESQADATANTPNVSSAKVLLWESVGTGTGDDGFQVSGGTESDAIAFYVTGVGENNTLKLYREEQDGNDFILFSTVHRLDGDVDSLPTTHTAVFQMDYKDSLVNVDINWTNVTGTGNGGAADMEGNIIINPTDKQRIDIFFEEDPSNDGEINYLGHSDSDTTTTNDLRVLNATTGGGLNELPLALDISGWEEDTRTDAGIILRDPDAHQSGDDFEMSMPSDINDFKVNVLVNTGRRSEVTTTDTGGKQVCTVAEITTVSKKDNEISDPTRYNLVVVGGPAVNTIAEEFIGSVEDFRATYSGGEAVIRLAENGDNVALIVAGFNADDTRRAAKVVANYAEYSSDLEGKTEVVVKGTTLDSATVE